MFFKSKTAGAAWLVVFLGNPGPRYAGTRHNVGFMTADHTAKAAGVRIDRLRFKAYTAQCTLGGEKVLLLKPQTYMNLSGEAVRPAADFYKIPPERVLVVSDDVSLPLGKLRIRQKGSAGGHNGLKDIIAKLGTDAFPRIKIGVGSPDHPEHDMADWVLGSFKNQDAVEIEKATKRAAEAIEVVISQGVEKAMNLYN